MKRNILGIAVILLLFGCNNERIIECLLGCPPPLTSAVSVKIVIPKAAEGKDNLMAPGLGAEQKDVTSVNLAAWWDDVLKQSVDCNKSNPSSDWQCYISDLPSNTLITIKASAKDINHAEIFKGEAKITLKPDDTKFVTIQMQALNIFFTHIPAMINSHWSSAWVVINSAIILDITIMDNDADSVSIKLATSSNGSFNPSAGTVNPSAGIPAAFQTIYTAGSSAGVDTITVNLDDNTGLTSTYTIDITVFENAPKNGKIDSSMNFPPDITSINGTAHNNQTVFTATVSDDQDVSGISYKWFINDSPACDNVTACTNPITISTPKLRANITAEVTDLQGASRRYTIIWEPSTLSHGLVAHYSFDGNANDDSGNKNNGTVNGAVLAEDRFGNANKAYKFDGENDYITVNDHTTLDFNGDFSFSFWVSGINTSETIELISKRRICNKDPFLDIRQSAHKVNLVELEISTSSQTTFVTANPINDGLWHHLVFIREGTKLKAFTDQVLSNEVETEMVYNIINNEPLQFSNGPCIRSYGTTTKMLNGSIDDVYIYNRSLTKPEIMSLYNEGK